MSEIQELAAPNSFRSWCDPPLVRAGSRFRGGKIEVQGEEVLRCFMNQLRGFLNFVIINRTKCHIQNLAWKGPI